MSEQVRFVTQRDEEGKSAYGYHHSEDNRGRALTPTQSDIESARLLKKMNGDRGQSMGFIKFYVTIQYYRFAGMSDPKEDHPGADGKPREQWKFLRASEPVEITGV